MTVEQIQSLILHAVKEHLGGDAHKKSRLHQDVDTLYIPRIYQPPKFQLFDKKGN